MDILVAVALSLSCALLVELIFRLIKSGADPRSVLTYAPVHYLPVSAISGLPQMRWVSFFAFRTIPPGLIMLLLAAVLNKYLPALPIYPYTLLVALLSSAPRSGYLLIARRSLPAERWIHAACLFLSVGTAVLVALLDKNVYLIKLAPDFSGLIDNLWSSLFAALLVVLYIDSMRLTKKPNLAERRQPSTYVVHWFDKLHSIHGERISIKVQDDVLLKLIIYSILIVENYNRPAWIRKIENLLARLPHTELTVGIAQVRSRHPLSDAESIDLAIEKISKFLKDNNAHIELNGVPALPSGALEGYNQGDDYRQMVTEVFHDLIRLKPSSFGIAVPR